jgi:hypothetical protein
MTTKTAKVDQFLPSHLTMIVNSETAPYGVDLAFLRVLDWCGAKHGRFGFYSLSSEKNPTISCMLEGQPDFDILMASTRHQEVSRELFTAPGSARKGPKNTKVKMCEGEKKIFYSGCTFCLSQLPCKRELTWRSGSGGCAASYVHVAWLLFFSFPPPPRI